VTTETLDPERFPPRRTQPEPAGSIPREPSPEIRCGSCLRVWPEMTFVKLETGEMARACKHPGPCLQHAKAMHVGRWDPAVGIVPAWPS
jgi:hypothetical protein